MEIFAELLLPPLTQDAPLPKALLSLSTIEPQTAEAHRLQHTTLEITTSASKKPWHGLLSHEQDLETARAKMSVGVAQAASFLDKVRCDVGRADPVIRNPPSTHLLLATVIVGAAAHARRKCRTASLLLLTRSAIAVQLQGLNEQMRRDELGGQNKQIK